MKVNLSALINDRLINKAFLTEVINDLTLYSFPQEELIKLLKNKN